MNSFRYKCLLFLLVSGTHLCPAFTGSPGDTLPAFGNESFRASLLQLEPFQYDRLLSPFGVEPFHAVDAGVFRFGIVPYEHLFMRQNKTLELDTNLGVSEVNVVMGSKREQLLFLDHRQRIARHMTGRLAYNSIVSPGFLLNSLGRYQRIFSGFDFSKGRVNSTLEFQYTRLSIDENGGVLPDQVVDGLSLSDFEQLKTILPDDSRSIRVWRLDSRNEFLIARSSDSISTLDQAGLYLGLDAGWERFGTSYTGLVDSAFYPVVFEDSLNTTDTSAYVRIGLKPALSWRWVKSDFSIRLDAGVSLMDVHSLQNGERSKGGFASPFVSFSTQFGRLMVESRCAFVLNEWYNQGDFSWMTGLKFRRPDGFLVGWNGFVQQRRIAPGLLFSDFKSNQFQWSNDFVKEDYLQAFGRLDFWDGRISTHVDAQRVNDWVYLNESAIPVQSVEAVSLIKSGLTLNSAWRKWQFSLRVNHAAKSGVALRYPRWSAWSRLAYKAAFFKKALKAEIGCVAYGTQDYEALAFMPITGQFYLQSGFNSGGEPVLDAFIHAAIGKATLSLVVQRLNDGLLGGEYYLAPGYPAPPRTLKFVLRWMLFN